MDYKKSSTSLISLYEDEKPIHDRSYVEDDDFSYRVTDAILDLFNAVKYHKKGDQKVRDNCLFAAMNQIFRARRTGSSKDSKKRRIGKKIA